MMPGENIAAVRSLFRAWSTWDRRASLALLTEDVVIVNHPGPDGGAAGRGAARAMLARVVEGMEDYRVAPGRMVELQGDRVAVEVHEDVRGEASGIAVKRLAGAVFAIRGGLVSRIEWFGTAREAFAAVGVAGVGLSPENEDAAIGFLAAFQDDDVAAMLAVTDPDIEIRGRLSLEQVYRGHEGVRRWHQDRRDAWERFDIVLERLVAADEDTCVGVYALGARGRESGIELRERIAVLGSLRDGLIMAGQVFLDPSEAFAAAGMEAP